MPLAANEIEAANRAGATAVLIRAGYRVYRPEADVREEDSVIRVPNGELRSVLMKGLPVVQWKRYQGGGISRCCFPIHSAVGAALRDFSFLTSSFPNG
jgi:hypothetical protein